MLASSWHWEGKKDLKMYSDQWSQCSEVHAR